VPFGALIDRDGRYRLERIDFTYLTSSRELARSWKPSAVSAAALVIGAPDFSAEPSGTEANPGEAVAAVNDPAVLLNPTVRGRRSRDFSSTKFEPLPSAEVELQEVAAALGVTPVLGAAASESALKAAHSPRILHIATHAFFLEDLPRAGASPSKRAGLQRPAAQENPLLRAGLVLSGANRRGADAEDGILTGLEAASLDLAGTQLLVLSACDTGLGELRNGDGIYGLRRAFALAGVRSQITSLWQVNDQATRFLMVQYYRYLSRGMGRGEALRKVQLAMARDPSLASPYYWGAFLLAGDWGPLPEPSQPAADRQ
jgi:CHAT domain-containing protein